MTAAHTSEPIPGPDPGACPKCGQWRKAGMLHDCPGESAATTDIERLRVELVRKDEQVRRLVLALTNIADTDYRGNRSMESVQAHRALVEEGFRAE